MRLALAITAMAATLAFSGVARAADFDDFQTTCVKTGADPKTVLANADASGWMPVPEQLMASLRKSTIQQAEGRMRRGEKGMQVLLAGVGSGPLGDQQLKLSLCAMDFASAADDLAGQLAGWAGVPEDPNLSTGDTHVYLFSTGPDGHKPVVVKGDRASALVAAHAAVAFVDAGPQITMVGYGLPTP